MKTLLYQSKTPIKIEQDLRKLYDRKYPALVSKYVFQKQPYTFQQICANRFSYWKNLKTTNSDLCFILVPCEVKKLVMYQYLIFSLSIPYSVREKILPLRGRQDSNLRCQRESDFQSDALTTRPRPLTCKIAVTQSQFFNFKKNLGHCQFQQLSYNSIQNKF